MSLLALSWGCPGDGTAKSDATCDTAAENLTKVCGIEYAGESFRALCEIESGIRFPILVPQSTRDCVAILDECTEETYEACGIRSITFPCREDVDCPMPWRCDQADGDGHCARCLEDTDCAEGRGCLEGLCYDIDSDHYKTFKALFDRAAGAP